MYECCHLYIIATRNDLHIQKKKWQKFQVTEIQEYIYWNFNDFELLESLIDDYLTVEAVIIVMCVIRC